MNCTLCVKPVYAKGFCRNHHMTAWRRARGVQPKIVYTPEQRIEKTRESGRRSAAKNRERIGKYVAAHQKAHPEQGRARMAKWRANNLDRARERVRVFMNAHPEFNAKRRARLAMPAWANAKKIAEMYEARRFAQECFWQPIHVDHIVPLNSPLVCGLHCEENLQLLPGAENSRKHNRRWPDMWSN